MVVHERKQSSADGQNHAHDRQQLRRVHYFGARVLFESIYSRNWAADGFVRRISGTSYSSHTRQTDPTTSTEGRLKSARTETQQGQSIFYQGR